MSRNKMLPVRQVLRLTPEADARLKRIAERETKQGMTKVWPADVMRTFILQGLDEYERKHPAAPTKGSGIR